MFIEMHLFETSMLSNYSMTDKEKEEECVKIAKQCIKDNKIIFDALAKL